MILFWNSHELLQELLLCSLTGEEPKALRMKVLPTATPLGCGGGRIRTWAHQTVETQASESRLWNVGRFQWHRLLTWRSKWLGSPFRSSAPWEGALGESRQQVSWAAVFGSHTPVGRGGGTGSRALNPQEKEHHGTCVQAP